MPIDSHSSIVFDGEIYVFGGFIGGSNPHYSNKLYHFDVSDLEFRQIKTGGNSPKPRTDHTAVVVGTKMVIFGGLSQDNQPLQDTWNFDFKTKDWSEVIIRNEGPTARLGHASIAYEGLMFVLGGHEEAFKD